MSIEKWESLKQGEITLHQSIAYLCCQPEMGKEGTEHLQFHFVTKNPRTVNAAGFIRMGIDLGFVGAHIEVRKGTFDQAEEYCSKEGSDGRIDGYEVTRLGDRPPGQGARSDLYSLQDDLIEGKLTFEDLLLKYPMEHSRYKRHWEDLEDHQKRKIYRKEMPEAIWLWGDSGAGKSHLLFTKYAELEWITTGELYLFDLEVNKWWDGFNPSVCKTVGLNEFRGQVRFSTLMAWVDKWPMNVPVRGRQSIPLKFDTLVVTSVFHPKDVYKRTLEDEGEPWKQFTRRFKIVHVMPPLGT